jgi:probable aminopeptidase NPEPL1
VITEKAKAAIGDRTKRPAVVLTALEDETYAVSALSAMVRIVPPYANKFRASDYVKDGTVHVGVLVDGKIWNGAETRSLPKPLRRCQSLVDSAPNELCPNSFVEEAKRVAAELGASVKIVEIKRYAQLVKEGYGCLAGVGSASSRDGRDPALVHLRFVPKGCTDANAPSIAFVGKGITFDTGGLSLKSKDGMCGMKTDMGGAAGMLGAFEAIAAEGNSEGTFKTPLDLVLCIAENAIGSGAIRPDDILVAKSGKTVEINNTDAEGRLVLADGVAYCTDPSNESLKPFVVIDMATLTGAQMIATGRKHAGIVTDDEDMEDLIVKIGKLTGDLAHALPYAPEMFKSEFSSKVADMKNSVADRANAQSSCAGQFIANHLHEDWVKRDDTKWLHIDMAGPGNTKDGLATAYGVTLLHALYKHIDANGV